MNTADSQPCAQCGRVVPMSGLVYDGQARLVCTSCESAVEIDAMSRSNVTRSIVAPPVLALLGTMMFCVPMLNFIVPFVTGLIALAASVQAIRLGADISNPGVTANNQPLLFISGILAGLWALGIVAIQLMSWIGMSMMSGSGYGGY